MTGTPPVRWTVESLSRPKRGLLDHFVVRFPRLTQRLAAVAIRLPAGSRLRRMFLTRAVQFGWEANNRRDWDTLFAGYSSQVEVRFADPAGVVPDMNQVYHGIDGARELIELWRAGFAAHRFEPREIIDPGGDRFGNRLELIGRGAESGIEIRQMQWAIWWVRGGMVVKQVHFWDERDFLAALEVDGR